MTVTKIALTGDSAVQLTGPSSSSFTVAQGGKGGDWELATEMLANIPTVGPLLCSGMRGVWLNAAPATEWSFTSGGNAWTAVASTDAWDKCFAKGYYGNGTGKQATATLPSQYRAAVGFDVLWFDYTGGGNWQYSVDGGTVWINMGQTLANDNKLCMFYVATPIPPGGTVKFRCFNGTSDCGCGLAGIRWWYAAPSATQGLIVDNYGANSIPLHQFVLSTSGDRLAPLDSVKLGTGSPVSPTPNAGVILEDINDGTLNADPTVNYVTDLTTFNTRVSPLGPRGLVSTWEIPNATIATATQASYRAQNKTTGTSLSMKLFDIYDAWNALGFGGNAGAIAAGFLFSDNTHPSQAGHLDLAIRLYWFVRNQILGLGDVQGRYTVAAPNAGTVAYKAAAASVAYTAGLPISV